MISEYDVTFAVKEWLLENSWDVIAFNPPGAQGTFTIPNPSKDPQYKGQTGSISPDIVAVKSGKYILITEAKPKYNEKDATKLVDLVENEERMKLFLDLVANICQAMDIAFEKKGEIILSKAHGGERELRRDMETFVVSTEDDWDDTRINPIDNPYSSMTVKYYATSKEMKEILTK